MDVKGKNDSVGDYDEGDDAIRRLTVQLTIIMTLKLHICA